MRLSTSDSAAEVFRYIPPKASLHGGAFYPVGAHRRVGGATASPFLAFEDHDVISPLSCSVRLVKCPASLVRSPTCVVIAVIFTQFLSNRVLTLFPKTRFPLTTFSIDDGPTVKSYLGSILTPEEDKNQNCEIVSGGDGHAVAFPSRPG